MLRERKRQSDYGEYVATILWSIGRLLGGEEYPMPSYSDFVHPAQKDTRTACQIIGGLIEKLNAGGGG